MTNSSWLFRLTFVACLLTSLPANAQVTRLSFRPVDAAYSLALDRIVLISTNPNQLHIYNPAAQSDQTVSLAETPLNLSLSPDGKQAAVAFADAVAYVDLPSASIKSTFSNLAVGTGKVIFGSGYVYVFPSYEGSIISIDLATGQATTGTLTYASGGVFDSAVNAIYSTENGLSPNSLNQYDASSEVLGGVASQTANYFAVFSVCGPLWLSHDGATIYSSCGAVYRASTDQTEDMHYLGILSVPGGIQSLATSDSLHRIAAIPKVQPYAEPPVPLADTVVNLYDSSSFVPAGQFATTPFMVNSASFPAHGRWVFYNSSSSAAFIITQADSSAGLEQDYGIENVGLGNPNSCNATFDATSASAIGPGGYGTAQITSGEDCVFTAVSDVPWITLTSGYYGSGNTTLTYLVRPNLATDSRSGTITIGSQTFTVTQDPAAAASALNPLSFKPVAADYDKAFDKIVMVSTSPNELHIYDPVSQADEIVPLEYIPLSVSVRPDGLFAAVGHSGHISIVNLQSQIVANTITVDMDCGGILLAANGYAYAFPTQTASWATINSVQLSTGALTGLQDIYLGNIPRLDASGNFLYVDSGGGASKLNISNGPARVVSDDYGTLPAGNIWLSEDGNRLFTFNGEVFFTSADPAQDLLPDGNLSGVTSVDWAVNSEIQHQTAVLTDVPASNAQLQIYADNGLQLQSQIAMPAFSNADGSYVSHGRYLFWNTAASKLFAITEADSTSGLLSDYAVYTVEAPESLPRCTYSVSPTSFNIPASSWYTTLTFNVTATCSSRPVSNSSWIRLNNPGETTGNGQVSFVITQANSGAARSGSITVGDATVTINQAAATCSYAISSTSQSFPQSGGAGTVNITTAANCSWSVQANNSWLTAGPQSGTGSATVQFSVAPNGSTQVRYGSVYVAGQELAITQLPQVVPDKLTFNAGAFTLTQGQSSNFGSFDLVMQGDGNLVLYGPGGAVWSTGTYGQNCSFDQCFAAFQGDGNLVVYNGSTPLWSSGTYGHPGAKLVLSDQLPQLEIVGSNQSILWTNTPKFSAGNFALAQGASIDFGSLTLVMQGDGNLVLYGPGGTPVWATGTYGQNCETGQCFAAFQSDGNLVVYNGSTPLWSSATYGHPGAELVLSDQSPQLQIVGSNQSILWTD